MNVLDEASVRSGVQSLPIVLYFKASSVSLGRKLVDAGIDEYAEPLFAVICIELLEL